MKMIISAGGTGGHIYPALAIIDTFKKNETDFDVLYIGTHNRMENEIVPKRNIKYIGIEIYGFSKSIKRNLKTTLCLYKSYHKCLEIMKEYKPDIVVGVGGYVTMPVLLAAKKLKIKTVIHEQNSIPGMTNKFLSRGVDKIFVSFKSSIQYFPDASKCIYSGNPSSDNVRTLKPLSKTSLGFSKDKKLVIVTSGSLGSSALNDKLITFLKLSENSNYEVLFITGKRNYEEFTKNKFSNNIKIMPYLDNLAALFKESDLIISRAGASTIAEIKVSLIPSILIPSPNVSNNHQYYNALDMDSSGLAIKIDEDNLDGEKLYYQVSDLLTENNKEYKRIVAKLKMEKDESSSKLIYDEIKKVIKNV